MKSFFKDIILIIYMCVNTENNIKEKIMKDTSLADYFRFFDNILKTILSTLKFICKPKNYCQNLSLFHKCL